MPIIRHFAKPQGVLGNKKTKKMKRKIKYKHLIILFSTLLLFSCKPNESSSSEGKIKELVSNWNKAHNEKSIGSFDELYAAEVQFYLKKLSKNECLEEKLNLFKKYPDFFQQISREIEVDKLLDNQYKSSFVKSVTVNQITKDYPSYLIFDDKGKIIAESDLTSETGGAKKNEGNTVAATSKNYGKSFIKGANNGIIVDYEHASNGTTYNPTFPTSIISPNKIQVFFNQLSLDLNAEYQNGQRVQLPYKFELGYDKADPEISMEKESNKYFIGQYDFDEDGIDEIIFAVQDNDQADNGISISVIKYFPPSNESYINRKENWELLGFFSAGLLSPCEGVIKDKSIRFDRGLRGFYYEWTFVKGKFIDTGGY